MRVDATKHPKLTEHLVQKSLAQYVQWWNVVAVPNLCLFHEMDLAVLTKAGCLWEYEIKLTQADWERDRKKDEKTGDRPWQQATRRLTYVKRFHYVYAEGLTCPEWVPEFAGLIEVQYRAGRHEYTGADYADVVLRQTRPPKDRKVPKPTEDHCRRIYIAAYHRYWRQAMAAA